MEFGGPVWHASASMGGDILPDKHFLRQSALAALEGVGDVSLGEWREWGGIAYHIRRRLSKEEQTMIGDALDIRGTFEAVLRRAAVQQYLPLHMKNWKE